MLRKAVDVTSEENRDLGAAVEQGLVEAANALRFFELEWLALPDGPAHALAESPQLARDRHQILAQRRYRPHVLSEPEERALGERDPAAVSAWQALYATDDLDDRGALRRRRRRPAAHHRPAAGLRARPPPRRAASLAGDAVRGARAAAAGARPLLRLAGRRPAGARPGARIRRRPDGAHPSAERAGRRRRLRHDGGGRGALRARPAMVRRQGGDARHRAARAGRPVRAGRRGAVGGLRRGACAGGRLVLGLLAADARDRRRLLRRAAGGRRAAGRQARRRLLRSGRPGCRDPT